MIQRSSARLDFHLHSYASNVTDYYAANTFAIPESYSDPIATYHELVRQGMSLVTLTDHNSIDGVKAMLDAGLPNVFVSSEMTATFPEDGCNVHVTVANLTEAQFAEVQRLRRNLYEMIAYVDDQIANEARSPAGNRLAYFMTHPLMSTQNRPYGREGSLTVEHLEKMLLLCNCLEVRNGTRTRSLNELTARWIESLDRATIERLANEHGIAPKGATPWRKSIVGGSDDHSGVNPGRTWTEFPHPAGVAVTANDVVDAIRRGETRPGGAHGGPITLAHAMLKLLFDGSRQKSVAARSVTVGGPVHSLLRLVFDAESERLHQRLLFACKSWLERRVLRPTFGRGGARSFEKVLSGVVYALLADTRFRQELAATTSTDDKIFKVVSTIVTRVFTHYVERIRSGGRGDVVTFLRDLVTLVASNVFVSLPYFLSYFHQGSDRFIVRDVRKRFDLARDEKLVLVTDTFFEVNGVSRTIRKMIREAARRGVDFTVVTCLADPEREPHTRDPEVRAWIDSGRLVVFPSIVNLDFPEYDGLQIRFPPFLELLRFLQESGFTKVQISTPGTVGLAGLLAAKLLQLETSSTYHTSFPEYVENYTKDVSLEALTWKYMVLFYHSVDEVVVPSKFVARQLHDRGLRKRKLLVLDRWVDLERFHPRHRVEGFWRRHGIDGEASLVKFLYFGRVGVEKNLSVLADAYRRLRETHRDAHLIVIGEGPYRDELARRLDGLPTTFVGFLEGEELARAVASCDVKLFPSTTDTWGNAPLEAQASGLPVVVSDVGGPQELMRNGVTGLRVAGRSVVELHRAMVLLMDPATRAAMGRNARAFVEEHRVDEPFTAIFDSRTCRKRARKWKKKSKAERKLARAQRARARLPELVGAAEEDDDLELDVGELERVDGRRNGKADDR